MLIWNVELVIFLLSTYIRKDQWPGFLLRLNSMSGTSSKIPCQPNPGIAGTGVRWPIAHTAMEWDWPGIGRYFLYSCCSGCCNCATVCLKIKHPQKDGRELGNHSNHYQLGDYSMWDHHVPTLHARSTCHHVSCPRPSWERQPCNTVLARWYPHEKSVKQTAAWTLRYAEPCPYRCLSS